MPTEHAEQVHFVQWMEKNHPGVRLFAIPNGGFRHAATATKLKDEGVRPGVPDIMIPALHLFIEMKREKGGRLSAEQKDWIAYLKECGYQVEVCAGSLESIAVVNNCFAHT